MSIARTSFRAAALSLAGALLSFSCSTSVLPQAAPAPTPAEFVNYETPHVSPLAMTPNGKMLLAVNTADNRLELFDLSGAMPTPAGSVAVGLDPVTVRTFGDDEAWVVNSISDNVSIVNLKTKTVVQTLAAGDEPADVAFAGGKAFVTCAQENRVLVFDQSNLGAAPQVVKIAGEEPRALAVNRDGSKVFVAIFESGNNTILLADRRVSQKDGPYGGVNPPPNAGERFEPAMNPDLPKPPRVSLILKKDSIIGEWVDDNSHIWPKEIVASDLVDHDIAIIDTKTLSVDYMRGLMNLDMHLTVRSDGEVVVVGTEATNNIRFEPNLTGRFVHSMMAMVQTGDFSRSTVVDLNPHLKNAYDKKISTVPQELRDLSIADPRGVVWRLDGSAGFVSGMGSNNVAIVGEDGERLGQFDVGQGPTGLALDEERMRLYVLNKFESTISVVDTEANMELGRVAMFDPTPAKVRAGRAILYDARHTSGLGVTACASCHVDARMDPLAWDLGNPAGDMKAFNQICDRQNGLIVDQCEDFHPMKGPMGTQTLQGIIGIEPFHWRGDREDLGAFNPAFVSLLGNDRLMTPDEMGMFVDLLASIKFPPNPNRNLDGTLKDYLPIADGNPKNGEMMFHTSRLDRGAVNCVDCHLVGTGTNQTVTPAKTLTVTESIKVPQLRPVYKKADGSRDPNARYRGFGFLHDARFQSVADLLHLTPFSFSAGEEGEQERRDMEAFVLSFGTETPPAVGKQVMLDGLNNGSPETVAMLEMLQKLADEGHIGLVVRGLIQGEMRGLAYIGKGVYQADRVAETGTLEELVGLARAETPLTWTAVPPGSERRIGIDRDSDGRLDRDEIDAGTDPNKSEAPSGVLSFFGM